MTSSRTVMSLKNSSVALIMYLIDAVLQFYSRKIFLDYLGTDILGLNTTVTNILQFLNIAELGISSAVSFSLYEPLSKGDRTAINEIVSLQGYIYKRIASIIIIGAVIVMCFFPFIFEKIKLPLWYAYLSFSVLLFSSLLGYFVNYKQVLLSASQQEYKILFSYKASMLLKIMFQMIALSYLEDGYIWWAILEACFALIASLWLHHVTKRNFPFLDISIRNIKQLRSKYKKIETKIKQLFFHKLAGFALLQTSPLILYAYTNLTEVTLYQNYMIIYLGFVGLMNAVFKGLTASIGNVNACEPYKMLPIFKELFSLRFYLCMLICFLFFTLSPDLVRLWLGKEYVLDKTTLLLLTIMLSISILRLTIENYVHSLGIFSDIWAPITEMILNVGCSILLGYFWGLNGILSGALVSLILIVMLWKPYFLFSKGLKESPGIYVKLFIKHLFIGAMSLLVMYLLNTYIKIEVFGWLTLIWRSLVNLIVFSVIIITLMLLAHCEICSFFKRIKFIFKNI